MDRQKPTVVPSVTTLVPAVILALPVGIRPPSEQFWFGTDSFGRDVYRRTVYGGRISLIIGFRVAMLATGVGLAIGLVAGYLRMADAQHASDRRGAGA